MKRVVFLIVLSVALLGAGVIAVQANIFSKRPEVVGTKVSFHYGTPVVFRLVINGQQLVARRSTTLSDSGAIRFKGWRDRTYDIELTWIETLSKAAFAATVSVPVDDLGSYDTKGRHVVLRLQIGANGAYAVETDSSAELQHIANQTEDQITPEEDQPIRLAQGCATPIPASDPRYTLPASWMDDEAMSVAAWHLDRPSAKQADPLASLNCTKDTANG
ncbi:MAG: hypothetical protein AAFY39_02115 [Pseudomonadota bacterium]